MGGTKDSVDAPEKEIRILRRRLHRAKEDLGKTPRGRKLSDLRREMNDIASQLGWALAEAGQYDSKDEGEAIAVSA